MIKSELIAHIAARNPHLFPKDAGAVVSAILERVAEALANGDRVELREFGSFRIRAREAHVGRNPHTGEQVVVPAGRHVHFRPGKGMQAQLNLEKVATIRTGGTAPARLLTTPAGFPGSAPRLSVDVFKWLLQAQPRFHLRR